MRTVLAAVLTGIVLTGCGGSAAEDAFSKGNRLMQSGRPGDLEKSVEFFKKYQLEMDKRLVELW